MKRIYTTGKIDSREVVEPVDRQPMQEAKKEREDSCIPNHITMNVEIKHEDASKIAELVKATKLKLDGNAEENEFDFNGIIPMPEELRDTESGS